MNASGTVSVRNALLSFGFRPDLGIWSDEQPGLSQDLGVMTICAGWVLGQHLREVVLFTGSVATGREFGQVNFEMPRSVDSIEQCAAWIAFHLTRPNENAVAVMERRAPWLLIGKSNYHLLPWEIEAAAWAKRPSCFVERSWAKLCLKRLAEHVASMNSDHLVTFHFDGSVLTIRCGGQTIATSASGEPWRDRFGLPASALARLPARLSSDPVEFSVWKWTLTIARSEFVGVAPVEGPSKS